MNRHSLIMRICILLSIVCVLATFNIHPDVLAKESIIENNNIILDITSPIPNPTQEKVHIGSMYSDTEIQELNITIDQTILQQSNYSFSPKDNQNDEEINLDYKFLYDLYLHNLDYTSEGHILKVQVIDLKGKVTELEETILFSNTTDSTILQKLSEQDIKDESLIIEGITTEKSAIVENSSKEQSNSKMKNVINVNSIAADSPIAKITDFKVVEGSYAGTPYKLTTTASSKNSILYQFCIQSQTTNKWTVLNEYNDENSYTWIPKQAGEYRIRARVLDSSSERAQDDIEDYFVIVKEPRAKITDLQVVEGGYAGTPYELTTTANSKNSILYQFCIQDQKTNKWTVLNQYNDENSYTWIPKQAGEYRIRARVIDSYSGRAQDDIEDYFVIVKEPRAKITDLKVVEGGYAGTPYELTTTANSKNSILYQFCIQDQKTNKWTVLNQYNDKNSYTWIPKQAGEYRIRARVIDSYSGRAQDDIEDYFVIVKEPRAKITDLKVVEGGYAGTPYELTTTANSKNSILYQFCIQDQKTNKWTVLNQYNDKNSYTWIPKQAGEYKIRARVIDSYSGRTQDDIEDYFVTVKGNLLLSGKTIMLDPGHGGSDPGAVNGSIYEKNLNNGLTQMIAKKLISLGANVIYTRNPNTDIYLSLEQRAEIANQKMPDLFISVHHDASFVKGFSIHYSSYRPNLETFGAYFQDNKGKTHNIIREVDGNAYYLENGCEEYITVKSTPYIIFDRTPSSAATNSKEFAYICYDSMKQLSFICPRNNPVSDHNLAMTRLTNMPSILIEGGPTNSTLANTNNQNAIADKMVDAIKKYFN